MSDSNYITLIYKCYSVQMLPKRPSTDGCYHDGLWIYYTKIDILLISFFRAKYNTTQKIRVINNFSQQRCITLKVTVKKDINNVRSHQNSLIFTDFPRSKTCIATPLTFLLILPFRDLHCVLQGQ